MRILRVSLLLITLSLFYSCGGDSSTQPEAKQITISGYAQKGPFLKHGELYIQELTDGLVPSTQPFTTTIGDDSGYFNYSADISANYLNLRVSGSYYNEISNQISDIELIGLAKANTNTQYNLNIMTRLTYERLKVLIIRDNYSYEEANQKIKEEFLPIFNLYDLEVDDFHTMDISKGGASNGVLLALSAVIQSSNSSWFIDYYLDRISDDMKNDGVLDDNYYINQLLYNANYLSPETIRNNLTNRYQNLGFEFEIPPFETYIDMILQR